MYKWISLILIVTSLQGWAKSSKILNVIKVDQDKYHVFLHTKSHQWTLRKPSLPEGFKKRIDLLQKKNFKKPYKLSIPLAAIDNYKNI